jgi:hypothetical protein
MPNVPLGTRFIGIAPQVNLTERKSALINAETQPYTIDEIASAGVNPFFIPDVISFGGTTCANISLSPNDYYPPYLESSKVEALNLTSVTYSIEINGGGNNTVTEISFPSLTTVGGQSSISSWSALQTLNISSLSQLYSNFLVSNSESLENVLISPLLSLPEGSVITFIGCALSETSVDAILSALVQGIVTNCSIDLSGGTNSAPSAQGLLDKATLETNGCTVTTN